MRRNIQIIVLIVLMMSASVTLLSANRNPEGSPSLLQPLTSVDRQGLIRDFSTSYQTVHAIPLAYEEVVDNGTLKLFLDRETMSIAIESHDGYRWFSSPPVLPETIQPYSKNWYYLSTGLSIETINDRLSYTRIELKGLDSKLSSTLSYQILDDGFIATVDFKGLGIRFDVDVRLEGSTMSVGIPQDTLTEYPTQSSDVLGRITVFPFLGATNIDESSGYAFIPDGSGALIPYNQVDDERYYRQDIYGPDRGIVDRTIVNEAINPPETIALPVFGMVHGEGLNGMMANVLQGAPYGRISSHLKSQNIPYNRTYVTVTYRDVYAQPISNSGETVSLKSKDLYPADLLIKYTFTEEADATYAAFARLYRDALFSNQSPQAQSIPRLRLDVIGVDSIPSLFGSRTISMTTFEQAMTIHQSLTDQDIHLQMNLMSWNKGAFDQNTRQMTFDRNMGSKDQRNAFLTYAQENDIGLRFDVVSNPSNTASTTAYKYNSTLITRLFGTDRLVPLFDPGRLSGQADDIKSLIDSMTHVSFYGAGDTVVSMKTAGTYAPADTSVDLYLDFIKTFDDINTGVTSPNAYMLPWITDAYDVPMSSSNYLYAPISVPFLQMVMSGHVTMYASYANFTADLGVHALNLIEYGVHPSFITTWAPTVDMREGAYGYLYTTTFDLWKDDMSLLYDTVAFPLSMTSGAMIIDHYALSENVMVTVWNNNQTVYTNYGEEPVTVGLETIEGLSYHVVQHP